MKKFYLLVLLALLVFCACTKNDAEKKHDSEHLAYIMDNGAKDLPGPGPGIIIKTRIGHPGEKCPGCIAIGGVPRHMDCMGPGDECEIGGGIALAILRDGTYEATTLCGYEFTGEDFFHMPNRSLLVKKDATEQLWLNIPGQLVYRDSLTGQFTFTGLYYTYYPVYPNN
ncbi:hypothetical protein LJC68_06230 [Bacteroidales bacterium OttesenSCG-928-B11]|nr:hypothetical protein [Bacteroidales bacterium OttesenSCG-928-B11]